MLLQRRCELIIATAEHNYTDSLSLLLMMRTVAKMERLGRGTEEEEKGRKQQRAANQQQQQQQQRIERAAEKTTAVGGEKKSVLLIDESCWGGRTNVKRTSNQRNKNNFFVPTEKHILFRFLFEMPFRPSLLPSCADRFYLMIVFRLIILPHP